MVFKVVCIFCIILSSFASERNELENRLSLGEKDFDHYYGPLDPTLKNNEFLDDVWKREQMQDLIDDNFSEMDLWQNNLTMYLECSKDTLSKHQSYIRFLYRLLAMDLYFKGEIKNKEEFDLVLAKCRPQSDNMQDLISKLKVKFSKELVFIDKSLSNEFIDLCSEKDSYYGMSWWDNSAHYLQSSSFFKTVIKDLTLMSCIKPYQTLHHKLEQSEDSKWANVLSEIHLKKSKKIGILAVGVLRQFKLKGLKSFLYNSENIASNHVSTNSTETKSNDKPLTSTISPIKLAYTKAKKNNKAILSLSDLFTYYKFGQRQLVFLKNKLAPFISQEALRELKKYDRWGERKAPVNFTFLWYLLHEDHKEGLFNLKHILGKQFYVLNDWEKWKEPFLIELIHTRRGWEVWIHNS